ncbi:Metallo-peptidase family M12-domain-containing protein [Aspergillus ambiguus]|uniref:Metallo-peptidase family M12-domain-containing protein n=1 Tax=Aspergillus ambiguus TaxID=176160 RepID=UPI003CCDC7CD
MRALGVIIISAILLSLTSPTFGKPRAPSCKFPWLDKGSFRLKDAILETQSRLVDNPSQFNITAGIYGKDQILTFILENSNVLAESAHIQYLDIDGNPKDVELPEYNTTTGSVWLRSTGQPWVNVGWARIVLIRDGLHPLFEGTFTVQSKQYDISIQKRHRYALHGKSHELIVRHVPSSDMVGGIETDQRLLRTGCMSTPGLSLAKRHLQGRDENYVNNIGSTAGCPQSRQIAYIGVVTDCTYSAAFDSGEAVQRNIVNLVNTASVVFENSFNISLGLRNLIISDGQCPNRTSEFTAWNSPCANGDMNWRLSHFSAWRSTHRDTNAYWTLMTDCNNSQGEVGVSWVGDLCNSGSGNYYGSQSGISANVVARTSAQWQVFTHEAAHMFGAVHDCDSDTCEQNSNTTCCPLSTTTCDADGDYIMNPSSSRSISRFSPCTIGNVCSRLGSGDVSTNCLVQGDSALNTTGVNGGQCGNGIIEPGEACDCGNGACGEREARCCDMMTCQWRGGDECVQFNPGSGSHKSWAQRHLGLVIGLSVGLGGGFILLTLLGAGAYWWKRRRVGKRLSSLSSTSS